MKRKTTGEASMRRKTSVELCWMDEAQVFQKIFPHLVFFDHAALHISPKSHIVRSGDSGRFNGPS